MGKINRFRTRKNILLLMIFSDCDYLKFKNNTIVEFFKIENTIYYIIVDNNFEIYEDSIQEILLKFFANDFKNYFFELDTAHLTDSEKIEYENILNSNITTFFIGVVQGITTGCIN